MLHPGGKWTGQRRDADKADGAKGRDPLRPHIGPSPAAAHLLAAQQHEQAHNQDNRRPDPDRRRNAMS